MIRHVTVGYLISMMSSCLRLAGLYQSRLAPGHSEIAQKKRDYLTCFFLTQIHESICVTMAFLTQSSFLDDDFISKHAINPYFSYESLHAVDEFN